MIVMTARPYGVSVTAGSTPTFRLSSADVDEASLDAWRSFLHAHARVVRALDAELEESHKLPLAEFDVLVQLAEAPGYSLRMHELADAVVLSRSGLTRLVDRLASGGFVARERYEADQRGKLAVLTPSGMDRLRDASPAHFRGVRKYVTGRLTPQELETLRSVMDRLG